MSETFKSAITGIILVATVTVFVLPREGQPVSTTVRSLGKALAGSMRSMLGTEQPSRSRRLPATPQPIPNRRNGPR